MAKKPLTDTVVRNLRPTPDKQVEVWDSKVPGFGIRVSPQGAKSFVLVYRFKARPKRLTIGRYPTLSLADARKRAQEAVRSVSLGTDPAAEKRALGHAKGDTFAHLVSTYIADQKQRNRSWSETERLLQREFMPEWGKRKISDVAKSDVTDALEGILDRGTPSAANHAYAAVRGLFNWAVERGLVERSPCEKLRAPAKVVSRDRVLSDEEIKAVWKGAATVSYPFGRIVQILLLTGQRRDEVAGMRWSELDLAKGLWSLPAERTKTDRAHEVPLSTQSLAILHAVPKLNANLVFPARGSETNSFSGYSKTKAKLDATAKVTAWRLHDLRRTLSTGMARLGVQVQVVEKLLNHTSGTLAGVAGVYNRFAYADEMRDAVERWGEFVTGLVSESAGAAPDQADRSPAMATN